jgi:16S rRNA (guanine527-N7)-methyltransferase
MNDILLKYFPQLKENQLQQFAQLMVIFPEWNNKVNCVSRKDIENLFVHHILHSLSISKFFSFPAGVNIADIGTGGGFPGIPLAILHPENNFDLVDSIGKKILVVKDIAEKLNLNNVTAINSRAEQLNCKYDFVVSRAVTAFPDFYILVKNIIKTETEHDKQGILYLKGGDFENEISGFSNIYVWNISESIDYEHFETKKIIYLPVHKKKSNKILG